MTAATPAAEDITCRRQSRRGGGQAVANVGEFVLGPREFTTRTGGLFLFIPDLVRLDSDAWAQVAKLPDSRMVPSAIAPIIPGLARPRLVEGAKRGPHEDVGGRWGYERYKELLEWRGGDFGPGAVRCR
jgi:hypothetical protein